MNKTAEKKKKKTIPKCKSKQSSWALDDMFSLGEERRKIKEEGLEKAENRAKYQDDACSPPFPKSSLLWW